MVAALLVVACGGDDVARWAAEVEGLRSEAAAQRAAGDTAGALETLERAVRSGETVDRGDGAVRAIRQDAHFALGRLHFDEGRFDRALEQADAGIALSDPKEPTLFAANLHGLRALSLEALGRPAEAITSYEAAQNIHSALFERALNEEDDR